MVLDRNNMQAWSDHWAQTAFLSELAFHCVDYDTHAVVTPELKARMTMIDSFHALDQFNGSFGLSEGCGCRMILPSRFNELVSAVASSAHQDW
jgi:hypothetical protein